MIRVIICGSRDWSDSGLIARELSFLDPKRELVVHGDAPGADKIAGRIAKAMGFEVKSFPADWKKYGKAAGPIRNQQMYDSGCDRVIAFKDDFDETMTKGGTENMVSIALAGNKPIRVVSHRLILDFGGTW